MNIKSFNTIVSSKKNRALLAFCLPVLICVLICISNGVYPFGDACILHIDMYHQYEPFFTEFMTKLKQGESLLYSFRIGLGSDFVSLFAYYLASPLNWLLFFVPKNHVIEFMTLLIIVKIGLSGLSAYTYLTSRNENRRGGMELFFSLFYALSGYMAAYNFDIMWLDGIVLFPWILMGLEKILHKKDGRFYCITLAVAILSNFYIAMMICMYLVIHFFLLLGEEVERTDRKQVFLSFFVYSLLAGGMGAVLLIPEAIILSYSGSSGFHFPNVMEIYGNLLTQLGRHCVLTPAYTTGGEHWANVYCGIGTLIFVLCYFFNREIDRSKKIKRGLLLLFFLISFMNNYLDFIWHGLHFPDSLPARQSFLYIFLMLAIASQGCARRESNKISDYLVIFGIGAIYFGCLGFGVEQSQIPLEAILSSVVFFVGYLLFLLLERLGGREYQNVVPCMLLLMAVMEAGLNFSTTSFEVTSRTAYTRNWNSVCTLMEKIEEKEMAEGEVFYRTEFLERLTKNDAAVYGVRSSTIFSSLMNIHVGHFYRKMGMEAGKNFYSYSGATPLSSAMLGVKYLVGQSPYEESALRTLVAEDGQNYVYENKYTLPLGFCVEKDYEKRLSSVGRSAISNLNRMVQELGIEEPLLTEQENLVETEKDKTRILIQEEGYYYASYTNKAVKRLKIENGDRVRNYTKTDHGFLLDLGWCKEGDVVEITNPSGVSYFHLVPYQLNLFSLEQAYEVLNRDTLAVTQFTDTHIRGSISLKQDKNLILSIPKEDGWSVSVDGKEVETEAFFESLIQIPLTKGNHQIVLSYHTPGLRIGALISLICLLVFWGYSGKQKKM